MDNKTALTTFLRSLPLLWLSITFLAGVILAFFLPASLWVWLLLAGVAAAAAIGLRKRSNWLLSFTLAAVCILFLGAARYQIAQPEISPDDLAHYNDAGHGVKIQGILEKPAMQRDGYVELLVQAEELTLPNGDIQQVTGLFLARTDHGTDLNYGDRLQVSGELTTPTVYENFSYRDYLARQGVYTLVPFAAVQRLEPGHGNPVWAALYWLRQRGVETLYRIYPAREASLLAGILLGDESGLSDSLKLVFNNTGTRHIIAISGFNISIIAGLFLVLFGRLLGARRGAWAAGIGIALYTLLVGADASVVRAAIMGILSLVALQTGRQSFALNTLGFSAACMAVVNPLVLLDISFQLSFAATLGLVLYSASLRQRVEQWLASHLHADWAKRISRPINDYVLLTLAAQITTLPILLFYFHQLSIFSLPANLLILPVQPALMVFGGISMLAGMVLPPLGQLTGFLGWAIAAYTIRIVEFFASLPWASQSLASFPLSLVFIYFAALAAISIPTLRQRLKLIRFQPAVGLVALAALSLWAWNAALGSPDGELHLTLLEVPGEALLVQTPDGRYLLLNAGGSATALLDSLAREIPFGKKLDWLVIAGRRSDQIDGLSGVLGRLSPGNIGYAINDADEQLTTIQDQAAEEAIGFEELRPGDQFELGRGVQLEIISVGSRGALLLLSWQNFQALLPLGMDFDQMEELNWGTNIGAVDLLLLADSGYPPLNPPEWIGNLSPSIAWVASEGETFDSQAVIDLGALPVFSTDRNGWIQIITNGQTIWFEVARH